MCVDFFFLVVLFASGRVFGIAPFQKRVVYSRQNFPYPLAILLFPFPPSFCLPCCRTFSIYLYLLSFLKFHQSTPVAAPVKPGVCQFSPSLRFVSIQIYSTININSNGLQNHKNKNQSIVLIY